MAHAFGSELFLALDIEARADNTTPQVTDRVHPATKVPHSLRRELWLRVLLFA
jgi:hypothetical protein